MISNLTIGTASTPAEGDVFGLFGAADGKISNVNLNHVSINGVAKKFPVMQSDWLEDLQVLKVEELKTVM